MAGLAVLLAAKRFLSLFELNDVLATHRGAHGCQRISYDISQRTKNQKPNSSDQRAADSFDSLQRAAGSLWSDSSVASVGEVSERLSVPPSESLFSPEVCSCTGAGQPQRGNGQM